MVILARRQLEESDVSQTTAQASMSDGQLDAIIGAAAAGSVVLVLAAILLGYCILRRRTRRRSASARVTVLNESRPTLEAPRKARRRSLVLSLGTLPPLPGPSLSEKPLPSPPATASLLSSEAFIVTPMTATFPVGPPSASGGTTWQHSEKSQASFGFDTESALLTVPSPGPTTRTRLGLVRTISMKRPDPIDVERAQEVTVEQAVDSGLRIVDSVTVPPPYTPK